MANKHFAQHLTTHIMQHPIHLTDTHTNIPYHTPTTTELQPQLHHIANIHFLRITNHVTTIHIPDHYLNHDISINTCIPLLIPTVTITNITITLSLIPTRTTYTYNHHSQPVVRNPFLHQEATEVGSCSLRSKTLYRKMLKIFKSSQKPPIRLLLILKTSHTKTFKKLLNKLAKNQGFQEIPNPKTKTHPQALQNASGLWRQPVTH